MSTLTELFTNIANAIRSKTGNTASIKAEDFPSAINGISVGVEGGIIPTGTKSITSNGKHRVYEYEYAEISVPTGITPSGTKSITSNGTHDVSSYASAEVNVPVPSGYIKPSGSINITENKTVDVTNYASAIVDVPVPAQKIKIIPVTISADIGNGTSKNYAMITGDDFVKTHYADDGFIGIFLALNVTALPAKSMGMVYHGNRPVMSTKSTYHGVFTYSNGESAAMSTGANTAKINGTGYGLSLRVNSSGNVNLYVDGTYTVKAGSYLLVLLCTD